MGIENLNALLPEADQEENVMAASKPNHDETDVKAALERTTQDGSGFESEKDLPESDFEGFDEDSVENNHDGDNDGVEGDDQ